VLELSAKVNVLISALAQLALELNVMLSQHPLKRARHVCPTVPVKQDETDELLLKHAEN
jgi:hypothetical protein